jgi:predicted nucleotidyltransferase
MRTRTSNIDVPVDQLRAFCGKWNIRELSLFGSVLRDDFGPHSDVDVLVSFAPGHPLTLEAYLDMKSQLSAIFAGRPVDLVEKRLIRNPFRRHEILTHREIVYAA